MRIVDKAGHNPAVDKDGYNLKALSPRQVARLIATDQAFRQAVSDGDRRLLERVIEDAKWQRTVIGVLIALVFSVAVIAFLYMHQRVESRRLRISEIRVLDDELRAEGLLVDTDPLRISWNHDGEPTDIEVGVENPRDRLVSQFRRVRSSEGQIQFAPADYRPVLTNRYPNGRNPIRVVVRGPDESFLSSEFEVAVSITIKTFHRDRTVYLSALIDDSTTTLPHYFWRGDVVYRLRDTGQLKVIDGGEFQNPLAELILADYDRIDWEQFGVTYHGPDDRRLIRYRPMHFSPAK